MLKLGSCWHAVISSWEHGRSHFKVFRYIRKGGGGSRRGRRGWGGRLEGGGLQVGSKGVGERVQVKDLRGVGGGVKGDGMVKGGR